MQEAGCEVCEGRAADLDTAAGPLAGERLGHLDDGCLGAVVGRLVRVRVRVRGRGRAG